MSEAQDEERQNANQEAHNLHKINRIRDDLETSLNDRQAKIPAGIEEEKWNAFKSIVYKVFKEKFGTDVRKHEDWFDKNVELEELINNRNLTRNNMLSNNTKSAKARYRTCCQLLQQESRELKNKWWLTKVAESKHLQTLMTAKSF